MKNWQPYFFQDHGFLTGPDTQEEFRLLQKGSRKFVRVNFNAEKSLERKNFPGSNVPSTALSFSLKGWSIISFHAGFDCSNKTEKPKLHKKTPNNILSSIVISGQRHSLAENNYSTTMLFAFCILIHAFYWQKNIFLCTDEMAHRPCMRILKQLRIGGVFETFSPKKA